MCRFHFMVSEKKSPTPDHKGNRCSSCMAALSLNKHAHPSLYPPCSFAPFNPVKFLVSYCALSPRLPTIHLHCRPHILEPYRPNQFAGGSICDRQHPQLLANLIPPPCQRDSWTSANFPGPYA